MPHNQLNLGALGKTLKTLYF